MKLIPSRINQYIASLRRIIYVIVFFAVCFGATWLSFNIAHAGIFSSIMSSVLGGESVSAKVIPTSFTQSSQTIALLQAAVNYDPNPEKVGDTIPIQAGGTLVADLALGNGIDSSVTTNTQISTYIVQSGDTLSGISQMFGVSVNTILWANDIKKASGIQPGQVLVILPVSGLTHIVKSGETIIGIVEKYEADLEEIIQYNDLTLDSTLSIGQSIILPDVELTTSLPTRIVTGGSGSSKNSSSYTKYYQRPIKGGVRTQGIHGYNGVDLAAPIGTSIYASAEGTVIVSRNDGGYNGGYGNFIIISHPNGTQTLYAHNSRNLVKAGEYVQQGDQIALMGSTGKSTGSHVHFEIRGAKNPF